MGGRWRRLLEEEGLLVAVVFLGNVGNFIFHIYMSRNLGGDGYSTLTALLSLLYVLSIPTMTIQASMAQFVAARAAVGDHAAARAFYAAGVRRIVLLALLMGGGLALAVRPLGRFLNLSDGRPLLLLAGLVAVSLVLPVIWGGLQGLRLFRPLGGSMILALAIKCGVGIGLVMLGGQVLGSMLALVLAPIAAMAVAQRSLRRAWRGVAPASDVLDFRPALRYALPVALGFLALAPYANGDIVLARAYLPPAEAGHYASVMILGKAFLFLPTGIVLALFPNVAHAVARDENPRSYLWPALTLGAGLSLVGAVLCCLMPGLLARVLVRSADPAIVPLIRTVGFVMTPAGLGTILLQYHLARRHWACLPGLLAAALAFVLAAARWHASAMQMLILVAACAGAAFAILLVTVWWPPARRPAAGGE